MYRMKFCFLILVLTLTSSTFIKQTPLISLIDFVGGKFGRNSDGFCKILEFTTVQPNRLLNATQPFSVISYVDDTERPLDIVFHVTALDAESFNQAYFEHCTNPISWSDLDDINAAYLTAPDEVVKIIDSGPASNRIDVVFMGDGYTLGEREKFYTDIKRLTHEMWVGQTFASIRPLVNVWAVFRPSVQSGIGSNGRAARSACKATGSMACDFPSLIANDDYYGGLGGEFTISTRSLLSGTVVLRHELGHNFISVGEEYDNGQVYSGVNSAPSSSLGNIKWKHWLSEPDNVREEMQIMTVAEYPWYDLSKGPKKISFKSTGDFPRWAMKISASGVESFGSLEVFLDGNRLDWIPRGDLDREFYDWMSSTPLSKGSHELEFKQGFPPSNATLKGSPPIRQLCSVEVHEYGSESSFRSNSSIISAYPTYDVNKRKTLRPTNEGCLMRNMKSASFCKVCQEGMWLRFLERITLIDRIDTFCQSNGNVRITASLIPLAHLRAANDRVAGELYSIAWFFEGKEQQDLVGALDFEVVNRKGHWDLIVKFTTLEIRKDDRNLATSSKGFSVTC